MNMYVLYATSIMILLGFGIGRLVSYRVIGFLFANLLMLLIIIIWMASWVLIFV